MEGGDGEGVGAGFREHILPVQLGEDALRRVLRHSPVHGPFEKALPVLGDEMGTVGLGEGPSHFVGLGGGETGHVADELHHLLLPDDDAAA